MTSGIYGIINKYEGKIYVGSSVYVHKRWTNHKNELSKGTHSNKYLQGTYNKYWKNPFIYVLLEEVVDENKLIEREQFWIDYLKPTDKENGYNLNPTAGSRLGSKCSEETKEKMRAKGRNAKPHIWPHGSKCLCSECRLIRSRYLWLQRNNKLELWYG